LQGEIVTLLRAVNQYWYEVSTSIGQLGLVPTEYIDILSETMEVASSTSCSKKQSEGHTNRDQGRSDGSQYNVRSDTQQHVIDVPRIETDVGIDKDVLYLMYDFDTLEKDLGISKAAHRKTRAGHCSPTRSDAVRKPQSHGHVNKVTPTSRKSYEQVLYL